MICALTDAQRERWMEEMADQNIRTFVLSLTTPDVVHRDEDGLRRAWQQHWCQLFAGE